MPTDSSSEDAELKRAFREIMVIDFLGGMVPGLLFILACSAIIASSLNAIESSPRSLAEMVGEQTRNLQNTPSAMWIFAFFVFSLVAFVIGHLFYRSDPKNPDTQSFKRLCKGKGEKDQQADLGASTEEDCQFPYKYYDKYLEKRGHNHLLPLTVWCRGDGSFRSKTFINLLKIRLRFYHPEKCSMVVWNEAHIRMASSIWYVARVLLWISFVGVCISSWGLHQTFKVDQIPNLLTPGLIFVFSLFTKAKTEEYLHYQRMREVFFVLETAFTAFRGSYHLLSPPLEERDLQRLNAVANQDGKITDQVPAKKGLSNQPNEKGTSL